MDREYHLVVGVQGFKSRISKQVSRSFGLFGQAAIKENQLCSSIDMCSIGGVDFTAVESRRSFSLTGEGGEVCECIQLLPDEVVEGDEVFEVAVSSMDSRVTGSRSRVVIKDDDGNFL